MGPFLFFIGAGIMGILVVIALVLLSRVTFYGAGTQLRAKPKASNVTVVNKRCQDMFKHSGVYTNYFILFDLGSGDKMEMPVSKALWKSTQIGARVATANLY